ncbi:hypothetical protein VQ044_21180 [Aurantimonas sp. C2-5-R2]|uniref:hypothetical protein n=1 Tax=unclassified Aurantimonas TaxID=2638230 RepID=UPI002E18E8E0|nr:MULTISPECIES: hypothetical protein [unclassified Aurantimonas]MEC5293320.1 hypothetical protein [Aurantimonas sp. C2-3-R2]MEC5414251.1 hypothetical protein [Aurantimonas sp. C2-4-R8]
MSVPHLKLDARCQGLVADAVARHGSIKAVAAMVGYSRTALSLAMSGGYRANSLAPLEAKIVAVFAIRITCPYLAQEIAPAICRDHRERPIPTADPRALRHWQACRFCPENPSASSGDIPAGQAAGGDHYHPALKRQAAGGDHYHPALKRQAAGGDPLSQPPKPSHPAKGLPHAK